MKKIALDFDGTIADTNKMKSILIEERLGIQIPSWRCDRTLCVPIVGLEAYDEIADIVYERESTLRTPPLPDAVEYVKKLAQQARLYLLTARPEVRMRYAQLWLEEYQILDCFDGTFTSHIEDKIWRLKLEICRENQFELLMDDDQRHFEKDGYDNIIKVLIKNGCHTDLELPETTHLVYRWQDFYLFFEQNML
ncbi:hypothetical protein JXJ21_14700 [candidate division KSB1 bacterium]|nr:hypothetical protein [candidate division KSB1 bacterium]